MSKPKSSVGAVSIHRFKDRELKPDTDLLAVEEPMEIRLEYGAEDERQERALSVTMRTPGNDFELAMGFLFTEGIIQSKADISKIRYCHKARTDDEQQNIVRVFLSPLLNLELDRLKRNFYTSSSCGVCGKESIESVRTVCHLVPTDTSWSVDAPTILALPETLRAAQKVFEYTGGLHACALFDKNGALLLTREDVGRHNALDKLIGAALGLETSALPLDDYILLLSGRASFELIQKAAMAGIRMVCAVGAPSSLAVAMARDFGITLIGFLRDARFNVYSHPERITNFTN